MRLLDLRLTAAEQRKHSRVSKLNGGRGSVGVTGSELLQHGPAQPWLKVAAREEGRRRGDVYEVCVERVR